jgi:hypothetical protein
MDLSEEVVVVRGRIEVKGCSRGKGSVKCGGGPGNWRLLRGGGGRLAGGRACRMVADQKELRESPSWVTTG